MFSQIFGKISSQVDSKTSDLIAFKVGVDIPNQLISEVIFQVKFQTQHLIKNDSENIF